MARGRGFNEAYPSPHQYTMKTHTTLLAFMAGFQPGKKNSIKRESDLAPAKRIP